MKIAIVPGSFDPMTVGHLDVIKRAAAVFDCVVVAVMINETKEYTFSMEERLKIAELTCKNLDNVKVLSDGGMLTDLAEREGACAIVKGIRNSNDLEYEEKMARYNSSVSPNIHTVFLLADEKLAHVSSTEVRARLEKNADVFDLISENALSFVLKKASKQ